VIDVKKELVKTAAYRKVSLKYLIISKEQYFIGLLLLSIGLFCVVSPRKREKLFERNNTLILPQTAMIVNFGILFIISGLVFIFGLDGPLSIWQYFDKG